MEFEQKRELLLKRIELRSSSGMNWKADAAEDSYSAALGSKYLVRVAWPQNTASLIIFDEAGRELFIYTEGEDDPNIGVMAIWRTARRIALGLDNALDDLLRDLE